MERDVLGFGAGRKVQGVENSGHRTQGARMQGFGGSESNIGA